MATGQENGTQGNGNVADVSEVCGNCGHNTFNLILAHATEGYDLICSKCGFTQWGDITRTPSGSESQVIEQRPEFEGVIWRYKPCGCSEAFRPKFNDWIGTPCYEHAHIVAPEGVKIELVGAKDIHLTNLEQKLIRMIRDLRFSMKVYDFHDASRNARSWDEISYAYDWIINILETEGFDAGEMHKGRFVKGGVLLREVP